MSRKTLLLGYIILAATVLAGAGTIPAAANDLAPHAGESGRLRLAHTLSVHPDQLADLVVGSAPLADGRVLETVKGIDQASGEIVGASFIGERQVDPVAVRQEADTLWRFAHGAKSAALVQRLQGLGMDDRLTVDLWFAFTPPDDGGGPSGGLDAMPETGESDPAAVPASVMSADGRVEPLPLSAADAQRVERDAAGLAALAVPASPDAAEKAVDAEPDPEWLIERKAQAAAAIEQVEEHNRQRIATLQEALLPTSAAMLDKLDVLGMRVVYASDIVPSIVVEASRRQIEIAARWPDVTLIDPVLENAGPSLDVARAAHNVVPQNALLFDGTGVTVAVVEGGRVFTTNPFMTVSQTRDTSLTAPVADDNHATAVGGVIRSTHNPQRGMASASTLISANALYNTDGSLEAAADWAAARAQVMNHSWGFKQQDNNTFHAFDRRLDHITRYSFRLNVHAAGNHGATNCNQNPGTSIFGVESPGRGYNTLTVGGFDDRGTVGWADDLRYRCSADGWPTGDDASGSHQKPEIAAAAVNITSLARTSSSTSPLSGAWSGTSFAAPAIAGTAANLMEVDSQLAGSPVATRALMLVGALHQPAETRAVSATTSTFATQVGPWAFFGASSSSFPRSYNVYARAGQRVRFAITWLSNVELLTLPIIGSVYLNDRLPADLDLRAYRSNGTTLVASSLSVNNGFEIVDFTAPATDTYEFRISQWGAWTGGATPFAAAARVDGLLMPRGTWWSMNGAPPTIGRFYDIRPNTDYSGFANQWRGLALRPATGDYDLQLYTNSWFLGPVNNTDTYGRPIRASSAVGSNSVDFILVDGNHWGDTREHYRAYRFNGSGAYTVNAANLSSLGQDAKGTYGPFTMDANSALFVFDVGYRERSLRRFQLMPAAGSTSADLAMALYRSSPGDSSTWARGRSSSAISVDSTGAGGTERMRYRFDGSAGDRLGLAVYNKNFNTSSTFYLRVTPSSLFSDGFNGD